MQLSVVIPAHNEEGSIGPTLVDLYRTLVAAEIPHELLVVNDHSSDGTAVLLEQLQETIPSLRTTENLGQGGFGLAVRWGLEKAQGDCIALYMADASDSPADLVRMYQAMIRHNVDCVFGTRFHPKANVSGYPAIKMVLNRFANKFIQLLFGIPYNDVTNAFKLYRRHVIQGVQPLLSYHFNLTVEIPLKAIVRRYRYMVIPNDWRGRKKGVSKLSIKEMGSRYLFIVLYCFLEKWLSRGDYRFVETETAALAPLTIEKDPS